MNKSGERNRTGLEIAVIGMNGRFPGAVDIDQFWYNLKNGVESITFFSAEELEAAGVSSDLLHHPNYVKAKGKLEGIEYFDSLFFGYTSREAELMDPQFRIFHECCWQSLENAGYNPDLYNGVIGLYAGCAFSLGWLERMLIGLSGFAEEFGAETLNDRDYLSTRIAYKLNLNGPGFTVQTACSTSLLAIHLACQGLLSGECSMALAGGVSVTFLEKTGYHYQEGMILSADGHCRAFDDEAGGTVFGDGVGVVVLKTLEDAARDGDSIAAIIKGSAINNDGSRKVNYTSPSPKGQAAVIRAALQVAEVPPESIAYIETHGTGTALGDPIEIEALKIAFDMDRKNVCGIGSVKTNVGHLNIAAGITGFIKTILALKHRLIPPSLHFKSPNAKIDFENSPFYVVNQLTPWENGRYPLRAGVSSFGIGGTNAHVILEEAPVIGESKEEREHQLILLSAKTPSALDTMSQNLVEYLDRNLANPANPVNPGLTLADAAYTLQVGRKSFPHRKMTVCASGEEAIEILSNPSSPGAQTFFVKEESPEVVFMFPGQGSQYVNMGLELYRKEPLFRREMDRCFDILKPLMGYDIKEVLYPPSGVAKEEREVAAGPDKINQTEVAQPVIFVIEYALAKQLMKWGIRPYAMMGHSIGEYAAACLSGVFSLEDALKVVAARGKLMQKIPGGSMLSVELPEKELLPLLPVEITLAAVNTTKRCVVSGPRPAIAAFDEQLKEKGIQTRRLHTSHAFHSGMMDPILKPFEEEIRKGMRPVKPVKPGIPYLSNLTGRWITVEEALDPGYWVKHLRGTVRFADGLEELLKRPAVVFVEVGPGKTLSSFVRKHNRKKVEHMAVSLFRHPREDVPDRSYLLRGIGRLWLYGVEVDEIEFHGAGGRKRYRVPLPTYPFERLRYWREPPGLKDRAAVLVEEAPSVKKSDIGSWFYTPCWKRSSVPIGNGEYKPGFRWLFFMDDYGIGARLVERMGQDRHDIVTVKTGEGYARLGDGAFVLNPLHDKDYVLLFDTLKKEGKWPHRIVHLWNVTGTCHRRQEVEGDEKYLDMAFYSCLYLAQALGKQEIGGDVRLTIITNQVHQVTGDEVLCPHKAAVLGPAMVIPSEYPNIGCSTVDIVLPEQGSRKEDGLLRQLAAELMVDSAEKMIALRNNYRLVQTVEPVRLEAPGKAVPRLKEGGVYLVTGGLGGIGLVIAGHLSTAVGARLVLTGRSPLPQREEWDQWLISHSRDHNTSVRIRKIRELEANGSEVMVFSADVSDHRQMQAVIAEAEAQLGRINGVIHAAGVPGGGMIQLKTREEADRVMTAKVKGTLVLDRVLSDQDLDFFILCSSINSVLPRVGQVDYYSANAFLDAFAYDKTANNDQGTFFVSINWDTWQEVGMAVEAAKQWAGIGDVHHPLFDRCVKIGARQEVFITHFDLNKHWVLNEHRVAETGKGLAPGVVYLEMAREAFENHGHHGGGGIVEISDVYFINPMMVGEGEERETRFILNKQSDGCEFTVQSRTGGGKDGWQKHAVGRIAAVEAGHETEHVKHDIEAIIKRCDGKEMVFSKKEVKPREGILIFGPRWRNFERIHFGENQALAYLQLGDTFNRDLDDFKLHPALLDSATGFLFHYINEESAYIPFSYKRLRIRKPLPAKIYSYSRLIEDGGSQREALKFDIVIMDEQGVELVDIKEFTMLEVSEELKARVRKREDLFVELASGDLDLEGKNNKQKEFLKNGILPSEGIDVFDRIMAGTLPQVIVSTVDLTARMENEDLLESPPASRAEEIEEKKFSSPLQERPELGSPYVAPKTETERIVADIWQELLGIEQIGIHDNFFELGGDSLNIAQLNSKLKKALNRDITVAALFRYLTVSSFTTYLNREEGKSVSEEEVKRSAEIERSKDRLRMRLSRR
jgi:acyl transferase domain-containing protein/acyl carrier protein